MSVAYDEGQDSTFERRLVVSQEGTSVTLCRADFASVCCEGTVQGNRVVANFARSAERATWCSQYELSSQFEGTIDLTIESDSLMRGTETAKMTYSGGPQPPVEHIATYALVTLRE